MRPHHHIWLFLAASLIAWGCTPSVQENTHDPANGSVVIEALPKPCGQPEMVMVGNGNGSTIGIFEVANDSEFIYFNFGPQSGYNLEHIEIYCGAAIDMPRTADKKPDPAAFPISYPGRPGSQPWVARMPWGDMPACVLVAAHVQLSNAQGKIEAWALPADAESEMPGIEFCHNDCRTVTIDCALQEGAAAPLTLPQDKWVTPAGKAAGDLLMANFATLFPEGISIGCDQHVLYSSAQAALAAMPMQGVPASIGRQKTEYEENALAGEILSLQLVLTLDQHLPNFTPGSPWLGALQVREGAFEGWTVDEVAQEAQKVYGGCPTNYSPSQIHEVVASINKAFAPGKAASGFLRCPDQ